MTLLTLVVIICAYLLGSISSAVLICQMLHLQDPREFGSRNPGATNVYRLAGKKVAAAVLLCDMLKGAIPVWSGYLLHIDPVMLSVVAVAACLGHMYPLFFHFKGGKGVATAFGAMAPISLNLIGLLFSTWLVIAALFRYSSVAALTTALLAPLYTWFIKPQYTLPVALLCCLIILRHNDNIKRLFEGTEPKVGSKKP